MPNTAKIPGKNDLILSKADMAQLYNIAPLLKKILPHIIENEAQYDRAVATLNHLFIQTGHENDHPLQPFIDALGSLISDYESRHPFIEEVSQAETLRYLMEEKNLRQADLKDIISQGNLSAVLNGKRQLTANHIEKLSSRFNVSPAVFFPSSKN